MDMDIFDFVAAVGLSIVILVFAWLLFVTMAVRAIERRNDEIGANHHTDSVIPLQVETLGDQFLCYHAKTMAFVCQGTTLEEIRQRFKERFPNNNAAIVDGDDDAIAVLKCQLKATAKT